MSCHPKLIAITGGIGSGKSVVSQILQKLGYPVYDSDSEARLLMDKSSSIKKEISDKISPIVINADHSINRKALSDIVFNDSKQLDKLNQIVHSAVRNDLQQYVNRHDNSIVFVETAILYQSKIDQMVDAVWEVTAPIDIRINRVMTRNSISAEEVQKRINSQKFTPSHLHPQTKFIINDDKTPILPQIESLLTQL